MCPVSFSPFLYINIYMYASPLIMHSFLFYFAFFRLSPSLSPSITPWLRRFLLPWAHPWRVSSIGPIWWRDHRFYCSYCCTEGSVKTPIPSAEPGPVEEGAQTKKVNKSASIPAETPTPQKGVTLLAASQTEIASPTTPLVILTNDPFAALSQAVKDDSSLMATPLSIPSSATRGSDANLSFEKGSKEVLEDSDDKPTMKKRVSNYDEEDSDDHETEAIGTCLLHLLGFLSIIYFCHPFFSFSLHIYLHNFLMQPLFILRVHSSDHRDS